MQPAKEEKEFVEETMTPLSSLSFQESYEDMFETGGRLRLADRGKKSSTDLAFDEVVMEEPLKQSDYNS